MEIKDKRESVLDNIRKSIGETEQILQKLSSFGSGMREEKQKIVNIFCVFVDKKTVDYSEKKKKFSKTDL
ncbi:MAG: hypothetical protein KH020_19540 [Clostridiales bacterium]|nr:hypothetical protein [Clostridiales bacterium]